MRSRSSSLLVAVAITVAVAAVAWQRADAHETGEYANPSHVGGGGRRRLLSSSGSGSSYSLVCRNTLDDSFFNKCRREVPPGPLAALGYTIASFVAPRFIVQLAAALAVLSPLFYFRYMATAAADAEESAQHERRRFGGQRGRGGDVGGVRGRSARRQLAASFSDKRPVLTPSGGLDDDLLESGTVFSNAQSVTVGDAAVDAVRWQRAHLHILNFMHKACYTLTLNVALYAIFRQHRPCLCSQDGGPFKQVGSMYGMPSGDSMSGGIVGTLLIAWTPFAYKKLMRGLGVFVVLAKCAERLALGFHSIGQVTTGATLGIVLSVYSENAPQYMIFVDVAIQILLGAVAIPTDQELTSTFTPDDPINLFSWWIYGVSFNLMTAALVWRFYSKRNWMGIRRSLRSIVADSSTFVSGMNAVDQHSPPDMIDDHDDGGAHNGHYMSDNTADLRFANPVGHQETMTPQLRGPFAQIAPSWQALIQLADVRGTLTILGATFVCVYVANLVDVYNIGFNNH